MVKQAVTPEHALKLGHRPLTIGYSPDEHWMLSRVVRDKKRGNIKHSIVKESPTHPARFCLYRHPGRGN